MESEKTDTKPKALDLSKMNNKECINFIWNALNKASSNGVYTIDESYSIRVVYQKIVDALNKEESN